MGDLNGLLRALRDEIALAGNQGATVQDILAGIDQFYFLKAKQNHSNEPQQQSVQNVDRSFKERVWSWLIKDQQVFVGRSKEGNSLSLSEVEARALEKDPLRLFTTEQQIWITLAGHEKDNKKLPAKSFELLEVIAVHREKGIMQPNLVKATGQDKRSVPQRTQKLADEGYIRKIKVLANKSNTSLLVLSRFCSDPADAVVASRDDKRRSEKPASTDVLLGHNKFSRVEKEIRAAVKILEDDKNNLMVWSDLRSKFQVADRLCSRLVAEGFRRLEELGIIARVRASAGAAETKKNRLFRCVQLLRKPTEEDWHVLFEMTRNQQNRVVESVQTQEIEEGGGEEESHHLDSANTLKANDLLSSSVLDNGKAEIIINPCWDPNRLLAHMIRTVLLEVGTTGLSLKDLRRRVVGPCWSRPIDRFLDHCVKSWQLSQPMHLRHLAIIRDSAQISKTSFYVHFAHDAFGVKVINGETLWEAVYSLPEPDQNTVLDEYGFEVLSPSIFAGDKNDLTLKKALQLAGNGEWNKPATEGNTTSTISPIQQRLQSAPVGRKAMSRTITQESDGTTSFVPLGRPRKYPILGAPLDFSNMSPEQVKNVVTSQKRAQEYRRKKAHKEAEIHIQMGLSRDEAEARVIAEFGLTPESYLHNTIVDPELPETRSRGRPRKTRQNNMPASYLPSILAHTVQLYKGSGKISRAYKKNRAMRKSKRIAIGYLPSILSHTCLHLPSPAQHRWTTSGEGSNNSIPEGSEPASEALKDQPADMLPVSSQTLTLEDASQSQVALFVVDTHVPDRSPVVYDSSSLQDTSIDTINSNRQDSTHEVPLMARLPTVDAASQSTVQDPIVGSLPSSVLGMKRKLSQTRQVESSPKRQRHDSLIEPGIEVSEDSTAVGGDISMDGIVVPATTLVVSESEANQTEDMTPNMPTGSDSNTQDNVRLAPAKNKTVSIRRIGNDASKNIANSFLIKSRPRGAAFDGTIAAMRKLIILDIVKNCHGVSPGDIELVPPFQTAYMKKFPDTRPDAKTIKNAKNTLVGEGKLKQIFFTCKSASGTIFTKSIITLPEIAETDDRVKDLQRAMSRAHPSPYYPPGIDIRPDLLPRSHIKATASNTTSQKTTYLQRLPIVSDLVVPLQNVGAGLQGGKKLPPADKTQQEPVKPPPPPAKKAIRGRPRKIPTSTDTLNVPKYVEIAAAQPKNTEPIVSTMDSLVAASPEPSVLQPNLNEQHIDEETESEFLVPGRKTGKRGSYKKRKKASDEHAGEPEDGVYKRVRRSTELQRILPQADHTWIPYEVSPTFSQIQGITPMFSIDSSVRRKNGSEISSKRQPVVHTNMVETMSRSLQADLQPKPLPKQIYSYNAIDPFGSHQSPYVVQTEMARRQTTVPSQYVASPSDPVEESVHQIPAASPDLTVSGQNDSATPTHIEAAVHGKTVQPKRRVLRTPARSTSKQVLQPATHPVAQTTSHSLEEVPVSNEVPKPAKTRRSYKKKVSVTSGRPKLSALEIHQQKQEKTPGIRYSKSLLVAGRQIQTRRERRSWTSEEDEELLVAVQLAQILYGGLREENNWWIISRLLGRRCDEDLCRRRWTTIRNKYIAEQERMGSYLRTAILEAYERGELPTIDYDRLSATDFEAILSWAIQSINSPEPGDIELPTHREAFEAAFSIQDFPPKENVDFYENKVNVSNLVRHSVLNGGTRVLPVEAKPSIMTEIDVVKTYILANVFCQEQDYDEEQAQAKLLQFPEELIEQATNQLLADKFINYTNKGRAAPGRTLDIAPAYLRAMQGKFSVSHFKYAAAFKEVLDDALDADGRMRYRPAFGDGEIVTILNLLAHGMLRLEGEDIPHNKFGLNAEGCTTRNMDKQVFNFETYIKPTGSYSPGLPCRPLPEPPRAESNKSTYSSGHIPVPCWRDIHENLLPLVWDLAVSAVVTVLITNTVASAQQIAKQLKPSMAAFEIRLIMEWLVQAGAAEWSDERQKGLSLTAWWWSVITTPINKTTGNDEATMIAGVQIEQ